LFCNEIVAAEPSLKPFSQSVYSSTIDLMNKYFDIKDLRVIITNEKISVDYTEAKKLVHGDEMSFRIQTRLIPTWCGNSRRLFLLLGLQEFVLIKLELLSDTSILIRGLYRELHRMSAGLYTDVLHVPCKLITKKIREKDDDIEWSWRIIGSSGYGSQLIEFRVNQDIEYMENLPEISLSLFKIREDDELWKKLQRNRSESAQVVFVDDTSTDKLSIEEYKDE
jgi:hypothetical protein